MKKIFASAAALLAFIHAHSQTDTTGFKPRKLKTEEINLLTSYYTQDGQNAAVTGGIGSQKLTDIATVFDIKLSRYDKKNRKHTLGFELGIDHYTSASSDMVDLKANSSASHGDNRIYPSLSWTIENEQKGRTLTAGVSSSTEFDYQSFGGNLLFAQKTKDKNGEFTAKLQVYLDNVKLVTPVELRPNYNPGSNGREHDDYGSSSRNTFSGAFSYSQVVNTRLQVMLLADVIQQQGFLSLPFHRVYFTDGTVHQEKLPDSRLKIPLGFRASYFLGDKFILRAYYRYYTDNWGLHAHTANLEVPVKITPFVSLSPFYRFYTQTAVQYFDAYRKHTAANEYYTSNYDLSNFNSHFYGTGVRLAPPKGVLGWQSLAVLELRYGHYAKNINMNANVVSLQLKFK
jgi:hypothetical protein